MVKWAAVRAAGPSLLVGSSPSSGQRADPTVATTVTASGKLAAMRGFGRWLDWLGAHLTLRVIVIAHHTRLPFGSLYNVQRGIINRQRSVDSTSASGHGRHGRTRCCPAPVAIGPAADIQSGHSGGWALLEGEDTLPIILHIDDGPFILGSGIQGFVEATE